MKNKNILNKIITSGIVLLVGYSLSREINKQLPEELKINFRKIILEALLFGVLVGVITFVILNIIW